MAQQQRALRTRATILRAAASVFGEVGYEAATISDILRESGVTKGALYFHFPSKRELAQAVLDVQVSSVPVLTGNRLALQTMVDHGMLMAVMLRTDPLVSGSVRLTVERTGKDGPDRRVPYLRWADLARGYLEQARAQGELLPHVDPERTADFLVGAFAGVQGMSEALSGHEDVQERIALLYQTTLPAIAVPAVLGQLDISPDRGVRVRALLEETANDTEESEKAEEAELGALSPVAAS